MKREISVQFFPNIESGKLTLDDVSNNLMLSIKETANLIISPCKKVGYSKAWKTECKIHRM